MYDKHKITLWYGEWRCFQHLYMSLYLWTDEAKRCFACRLRWWSDGAGPLGMGTLMSVSLVSNAEWLRMFSGVTMSMVQHVLRYSGFRGIKNTTGALILKVMQGSRYRKYDVFRGITYVTILMAWRYWRYRRCYCIEGTTSVRVWSLLLVSL